MRYKIVISTGENQETITWIEADSLAQARAQVRVEVHKDPEDALSNLRRLKEERLIKIWERMKEENNPNL